MTPYAVFVLSIFFIQEGLNTYPACTLYTSSSSTKTKNMLSYTNKALYLAFQPFSILFNFFQPFSTVLNHFQLLMFFLVSVLLSAHAKKVDVSRICNLFKESALRPILSSSCNVPPHLCTYIVPFQCYSF